MVKIAILGCGKIADQHVLAVRRIPGSHVVAACDRELLMAEQLGERFGISGIFTDLDALLSSVKPDAVHITTPPQSHYDLARACLQAGSHVYVEKPFTVTAVEAESLVALAQSRGLFLTAGHNYQFTLEMQEMRRLVHEGFLGGAPVHMESHWSYDLGDLSYVGPLLGSRNHWARRLPGQLFHNLISHGIARIAEFLDDDLAVLTASAHQSDALRGMGGQEVMDELRVMLRDSRGVTASFCFSTQIKPGMNIFRVYGPRNSLTVDLTSGSVLRHKGRSYKSYLTYLVPPLVAAGEHLVNCVRNSANIIRWRLYQDFGMKALIESFHEAIEKSSAPPIPYREIVLTARIMDAIFDQIRTPLREIEKQSAPVQ
jgi:predicted dehydrogenase